MSIQFMCVCVCVCVCVSSTVVIVANCTLALTQWGVLSDYVLGMGAISNPRAIVTGMDDGGPNVIPLPSPLKYALPPRSLPPGHAVKGSPKYTWPLTPTPENAK